MKLKMFLAATVMVGLTIGSFGIHAEEEVKVVATQEQEASTGNGQKLTTLQTIGACIAIPVILAGGVAAAYAMAYLVNRSISLAHEGGHALAAWLVGKKITTFHVSTVFNGAGCLQYTPKEVGLKEVFLLLAGPLGGATAYFVWGKLIEAGRYALHGDEHKDMNILAKLTGFAFGSLGALTELDNLTPSKHLLGASYGPCAGMTVLSDGGQIQQNLAAIAPVLGTAYPYIARAGLMAFVGYSAYRIYQMCKNLQSEMYKRAA